MIAMPGLWVLFVVVLVTLEMPEMLVMLVLMVLMVLSPPFRDSLCEEILVVGAKHMELVRISLGWS